jgi:hypothetical protein
MSSRFAILATAGLALLATACFSAGGAGRTGSSATPSALAFSGCMRAHGVASYPDPDDSGALSKKTPQQLGVGDAQYQAAAGACRRLLPTGGQTHAQYVQQLRTRMLGVARCMRAHGIASFPDPGSDGHFPDVRLHALEDRDSPRFQAANDACAK